jgi:hypothetical protein
LKFLVAVRPGVMSPSVVTGGGADTANKEAEQNLGWRSTNRQRNLMVLTIQPKEAAK